MDYRVISIGCLSKHTLWGEKAPVRTPHSTTTLIRVADRLILVDPGLPAPALNARLSERSGLTLDAITDVFLTNFRPDHRQALPSLTHAHWHLLEAEREQVGHALIHQLEHHAPDAQLQALLKQEIALLQRCKPAPDHLAQQVDLFPLPGYTPGTCGLLLTFPQATVLIAGDAVPTVEHLEQGQVLSDAFDLKAAQDSFAEAVEIADWIIPGHDNLTPNFLRRGL